MAESRHWFRFRLFSWKRDLIALTLGAIWLSLMLLFFGDEENEVWFSPDSFQSQHVSYRYLANFDFRVPVSLKTSRKPLVLHWIELDLIHPTIKSQTWVLERKWPKHRDKHRYEIEMSAKRGPAGHFWNPWTDRAWTQELLQDYPKPEREFWSKVVKMVKKADETQDARYYLAASVLVEFAHPDNIRYWQEAWETHLPDLRQIEAWE